MPESHNALLPTDLRDGDDALLADLTAPPSLEDAREAFDYWTERRAELPRHRRHERKEAERMAARWNERLAAAQRERYGPSLFDQLLETLGVRSRPSPRKIIVGLGALALIALLILIVLTVLVVVFWPDIGPVVRTLMGNGNGGDGG